MSSFTSDPSARRSLPLGAFVLALVFAFASIASAEEPPLQLSAKHLDMSASQLEATGAAGAGAVVEASEAPLLLTAPSAVVTSAPSAVVSTAPSAATAATSEPVWDSEFVSSAGEAPAATCGEAAAGVSGFAQCVEKSIRGGAGFDESSRVCGALFPGKG